MKYYIILKCMYLYLFFIDFFVRVLVFFFLYVNDIQIKIGVGFVINGLQYCGSMMINCCNFNILGRKIFFSFMLKIIVDQWKRFVIDQGQLIVVMFDYVINF